MFFLLVSSLSVKDLVYQLEMSALHDLHHPTQLKFDISLQLRITSSLNISNKYNSLLMLVFCSDHLKRPTAKQEILHDVMIIDFSTLFEDLIESQLHNQLKLQFQKLLSKGSDIFSKGFSHALVFNLQRHELNNMICTSAVNFYD